MSEPSACNASNSHKGGVACELDEGHRGMHRHGAHAERVVYWSREDDISTRAELVAELALMVSMGVFPEGDFVWKASMIDEIVDAQRSPFWTTYVTPDAVMMQRARLLLETVYPVPTNQRETHARRWEVNATMSSLSVRDETKR